MRRLLLALGLLLAVSVFAGAAHAPPAHALDVPPHGGQWVVDTARLLPPAEKNALGASLRDYAGQSGNQIVVLTIPGLEGEDIAAYANRVAREWGVGQKDKNNGVLILVAVADRKVRFEVGRGIEDRLPDILSKRIQMQITTPNFKAGRYGPGLVQTVAAIRQALTPPGEAAPAAPQAAPQAAPATGGGFPLLTLGLIVVAGLLALAFFRRNSLRYGRAGGGDSSFLIGLLLGILSSIFRGRGGGGGGFGGGGGGGGDGGFSGGGGDFGGGGSSSDW